jgi:hypothetical protein
VDLARQAVIKDAYHAGPPGLTELDYWKTSRGPGYLGPGIYLTPDKEMAESYLHSPYPGSPRERSGRVLYTTQVDTSGLVDSMGKEWLEIPEFRKYVTSGELGPKMTNATVFGEFAYAPLPVHPYFADDEPVEYLTMEPADFLRIMRRAGITGTKGIDNGSLTYAVFDPRAIQIVSGGRRDLEENPPWVDTLLTENWAELVASVEPDLLPLTVTAPRSGKRKIAPGAEYGCGHYGCVMATSRPGIVCKVTSDPTEARFVEMGWERLGRPTARTYAQGWPEGIVQYHKIIALSGSRRGRETWMLWRDEAWNVGRAYDFSSRAGDYDQRSLDDGLSRLTQFRFYAAQARMMIEKNSTTKEAVDIWRNGGVYDVVSENIFDEDRTWARSQRQGRSEPFGVTREMRLYPQIPFSVLGLEGARRLAANLQACEVVLQQMTNEPGLTAVGSALEAFLDHGMLLADVHHNNIGQPAPAAEGSHPGAGIRDWVITDPGHLAVLW